jgi:hypothetical protein
MTPHLPTLLSLTSLRAPTEARSQPDAELDATALQARLVEALLGDAMLTLDDLPSTWQESSPPTSLIEGSDYGSVALGEIRRSFDEPQTRRRIEQQLAVLPRWVVRDFPEADRREPSATPTRHTGRGGVAVVQAPAVAEAPTQALGNTLLVRYGTVLLALRYEDSGGASLPRALVETASARCREVAETLR